MAERPGRHESEEARRGEALRTLDRLRENEGVASSALARAARRATDHFGGSDAPAGDPVELWGRRIGRALSLIAFVALAIYLYATYIAK